MKFDPLKIVSLVGMLSACTAFSFADAKSNNNNGMGSSYDSMNSSSQTDQSSMGTITPSAAVRVENGADLFLTADFIYWKVQEDGLQYATTGVLSPSLIETGSATVLTEKGTTNTPNFKWTPGFKVGAGLIFEHDGWDMYAQYTWLASENDSNTTTDPRTNSTMVLAWGPAFTTALDPNTPYSASAKWKVNFNAVDLEMGREYYISQWLVMRPHCGLKGAWQTQKFNLNTSYVSTAITTDNTSAVNMHQNWWGVGLRTGLDTAWHFCKSFSMYGDFSLSALWGQFKNKRQDSITLAGATAAVPTANYRYSQARMVPVLELGLGLRYETFFWSDEYHFEIDAGWENQVWFDMNQFNESFYVSQKGNLNTQGFTLKVRLDF